MAEVPDQARFSAGATAFAWLRAPGNERQITDCLGKLAEVDRSIARGMASALLQAAANDDSHAPLAQELLDALSRLPALTCACEDPTGAQIVRDRRFLRRARTQEGRIDWVFRPQAVADSFELGVEVKINSPLSESQLSRYHQTLQHRAGGPKGLVLLTREMPRAGLPTLGELPLWLGVVLWEQFFPRLRLIVPDDASLAAQWPFLIEVLEAREDIGVPPPSWESIERGGRKELTRLLHRIETDIEQHARTALAARLKAARPEAVVKVRCSHGAAKLMVPGTVEEPALTIRLHLSGRELAMTSRYVRLRRRWLRSNRRYENAVWRLRGTGHARIADPPYSETGRHLERTRVISGRPALDVREAARQAIVAEITAVVRTGVLDFDLA